jgi:hypothetical protein
LHIFDLLRTSPLVFPPKIFRLTESRTSTPRQGDTIGLRKTDVSLTEEFLTEEFLRRYVGKKISASTLSKSVRRARGDSPNFEEFSSITVALLL